MLQRVGATLLFVAFLIGLASSATAGMGPPPAFIGPPAETPAPPAPDPDRPLLCCDNTPSPTCTCGGPRRGCCSHHKGVCGCVKE